jgi:hypothetical protein
MFLKSFKKPNSILGDAWFGLLMRNKIWSKVSFCPAELLRWTTQKIGWKSMFQQHLLSRANKVVWAF